MKPTNGASTTNQSMGPRAIPELRSGCGSVVGFFRHLGRPNVMLFFVGYCWLYPKHGFPWFPGMRWSFGCLLFWRAFVCALRLLFNYTYVKYVFVVVICLTMCLLVIVGWCFPINQTKFQTLRQVKSLTNFWIIDCLSSRFFDWFLFTTKDKIITIQYASTCHHGVRFEHFVWTYKR